MANRVRRTTSYGRDASYVRGMYVDGNTVRHTKKKPVKKPQKQISTSTQKNRAKAMSMGPGFVAFLSVVCIMILVVCVSYVQTKSQITARIQEVASLESELSQLKADNDAYQSMVETSVDIETIKKTAINKLGMKYPSDDQMMSYTTQRSSYVRQYQDVPDSE